MAKEVKKKIVIKVTDDGSLKKTKKEIDGLNKATGRASKGSMEYNRNMKGLSRQSSNASKNFSKTAQGMQGILVPAYAEVAARVFALTAAFNALSNAANFSLLIKGQAEYAKMTGKDMGEIARQVQKASKYMLDFKEASTSVALATTAGLSTSQITDMTKAAVDSSTALGRSMTDTMDRLTRGIVKAEPEILDEIGVIIRLDKVYKDYADSVDKSTTALTESEKLIARNTAIMGQLEEKFGGIADKLPPNYFQMLSSTVMDLINVMSSKLVDVVGPLLKFLAESKTLIVVLMAVIAKSLIGKIFPAFKGFGDKMKALPKTMDKSIARIEKRMNRLHGVMTGADIKKGAGALLTPGQRGPAFEKNALKSVTATIAQASAQQKKFGEVKFGPLAGISPVELKRKEAGLKNLRKEIKLSEKALGGATKATHKFQKGLLSVKKAGAQFASSQVRSWRFVGRAVQMKGVFWATKQSLKMLKAGWEEASIAATRYGRVAARANVIAAGFTGGVRMLGALAGKALGAFMGITIALSMAKMAIGIFHDFDTPFKRAADSAAAMSKSLDKVIDTIRLRDKDILNFEGITTSLSQTIKNAEFAKNLAESIYNATHEALSRMNTDMADMGFWDTMIDMVKGAFGKGMADALEKDLTKFSTSIAMMGSDNEAKVRAILVGQGADPKISLARTRRENEILSLKREILDYGASDGGRRTDATGAYIGTDKSFAMAALADLESKAPELASITELAEQIKDPDKRNTALNLLGDLSDEIFKAATLASQSLKDFGDGLTKYSKDLKGILDSVVKKTPWHEMAKSQASLISQWDSGNLTPAGLMQKVDAAGLFKTSYDDGGPIDKALKAYRSEDGATEGNSAALMRAFGESSGTPHYTGYDALMGIMGGTDAVKNNLIWAESAEKVAGFQQKLNDLKKVGGSTLQAQAVEQRNILNEELILKTKLYDLNVQEGRYGKNKELEGLEASTLREIDLIKAKLEATENLNVELLKYDSSIKGEIILLEDLYKAKLDDTGQDKEGEKYKLQALANQDDITKKANEYINSLDKTTEAKRKLANWTFIYKNALEGAQKAMDAAQATALKYSSFLRMSGLTPEAREEILGNATLKGIGEAHQKAITSASIMGTDRQFKKQVKYLDLYFKVEKLRKENIQNQVALDAGMKALYDTELINAREDLIDARWKARTEDFATAVQTIANGFGSAVSSAFNDIFMNKGFDTKKFRTSLAQAFASAGSKMIGDMAQKQVFGNKGLVAGMFRGMGMGEDWINTLFPKSELELAEQRTNYLSNIWEKYKNDGGGLFGSGKAYKPGVSGINALNLDSGGDIGSALQNKVWGLDEMNYQALETGDVKSLTSQLIATNIGNPIPGWSSLGGQNQSYGGKTSKWYDSGLEELNLNLAPLRAIEQNTGENGALSDIMENIPENLFDLNIMKSDKGIDAILNSILSGGSASSGGNSSMWGTIARAAIQFFAGSGGIAPGGFRAFAKGGIANKPTLGMVGEGKYNEAVVPLPDGESIPVKGVGNNNNVTVNVSVDAQGQSSATEASGNGAKELGFMLSQAVQAELVEQQRPGGLLSSY